MASENYGRNYCHRCGVELQSGVISANLDAGCTCTDSMGNESRACEHCHVTTHDAARYDLYDTDTYGSE